MALQPRTKGLLWLLTGILVASMLAGGLEFLAKLVPWSVEKRIARSLQVIPENQICQGNGDKLAALHQLLARLYPIYPTDSEFPISVHVTNDPSVNAFASLGGEIYVFDGLLRQAQSAEELAGVLAHEMEHVRQRHIIQGGLVHLLTVQAFAALFSSTGIHADPELASLLIRLKFSRQQEEQADIGGLHRLRDAHIDVSGLQSFFERMEKMEQIPSIISDHPSNQYRAQLIAQYKGIPSTPILNSIQWSQLKSFCDPN